METWLAWAKGPLFWFALGFMILGLTRHVVLTWWTIRRTYRRAGDQAIPWRQVARASWRWLFPIYRLRERASYTVTTIVFHFTILVTPILLGGHIVLIQRGTGLSWPAIPNRIANYLTVVAVLAAILLIVQRATRADSRAVSGFGDYAITAAIVAPFVFGFLVMHPTLDPFSFEATLFMHVISADLLMILIPTTKISHCLLAPASQTISEIAWHWPPNAGSRVAQKLGKEEEPI